MNAKERWALEQAERGVNNAEYDKMIKERRHQHRVTEKSLNLLRRTAKTGSMGRVQEGVDVLSGNQQAVFSDTKADGSRDRNRVAGVPEVNLEASKMGAPKAYVPTEPDDQQFFEQMVSGGDKGSEM